MIKIRLTFSNDEKGLIEFADETLVTPNMSAEILDNPELKEVDYTKSFKLSHLEDATAKESHLSLNS